MRSELQSSRLRHSDLRKLQKTHKQKVQKEVQGLIQLIDLPDFDVSEFFQTLMKSLKYQQVLEKIPRQKKVDFFSRNFNTFLETQEQLLELRVPDLQQIPKAKQFYFQEPVAEKKDENIEEEAVAEIVDSFSTAVLQKSTSQTVRIYKMLKEMKKHSKYEKYLNKYEVNKLCRQSFDSFIEDCDESEVLISLGEAKQALKKYLHQQTSKILTQTQTQINIHTNPQSIERVTGKLLEQIELTIKEVKQEYTQSVISPMEVDILLPQWLSNTTNEFYRIIEAPIFQKQQLSQILQCFQVLLQTCSSIESKGVCLSRQLKSLISSDLPLHMNKVVEVVVEAFEDILKEDNNLYEFQFFQGVRSFAEELDQLTAVKRDDLAKKCCSQKGILLINAFALILEPISDEKWSFMHENILQSLLSKVSNTIIISNWHYWDYYLLFIFFDRLQQGKVKHKKFFSDQVPSNLKEKILNVKNLSLQCWEIFQAKITTLFWVQILAAIPSLLWEVGPYIHTKERPSALKPTVFSIDLFFKCEQFIKNIQFRVQKSQFEHLVVRFYEYILYIIEYLVYWNYHQHGKKEKVFILYKKSERIYKKARNFSVQELEQVKDHKKIVLISHFSKYGIEQFGLDLYFLTEGIKMVTGYGKIECEQMISKMAEIESKEHKTEKVNVEKGKYTEGLNKYVKILREEPEKIKAYLESKRKEHQEKRKSY